ncbi:MAG TPA: plastocyanin/azurin family copper-binding protein [Longimicrobiaceae bacterium]|nr:plastocyanin/azurin family copper-binding protein [Longimicrobiaceae bacterium]
MYRKRTVVRPALAALSLLLLAACGGGGDSGSAGSASSEPSGSAPAAPAPAAPSGTAAATGDTITIRMVTTQNGASGQFEPAQVTARPGDVLHFVPDGGAAHNVSWPAADNPGKTGLPPASPYVTAAGQAVDQVVSMEPGTYNFQCDPHAPMGMKGTLTVS